MLLLLLLLQTGAAAAAGAQRAGGGLYACSGGKACCPASQACAAKDLPECAEGYQLASPLWGCGGEAFDAARLPMDWSWAGFRGGQGLPVKPASVNVRAAGAKGDGVTDDTAAIMNAIQAAPEGSAVFFPAGKYVIKSRMDIRKSVVLRGAGKAATTLYFPHSLTEAHGNKGSWAHGTCFVNFWGWLPRTASTQLASVTADAPKGSSKLSVDSTAGLKAGQWVRVVMADSAEVFKATLMQGLQDPGHPGGGAAKDLARFTSPIKSVGADSIVLQRSLPWDVKTAWSAQVHAFRPTVEEAGVESLTFEFPWTPYPGHLNEEGYNALHLNQVANSWVKDVRFLNADTGIYMWGSAFTTVQDVDVDTTKPRTTATRMYGADRNGHRAVWTEMGESNLFQRISIKAPFVHDFTVATAELGSVWTNSQGTDLNLDFHKGGPTLNLYTDLDMGAASRPFKSGGGSGVGPNTGAANVMWNLRTAGPVTVPGSDFGPPLYVAGLQTAGRDPAAARSADAKSVADMGGVAAVQVTPPNLWQAMRSRRG